ncbi:MAG: cation:proton antiporter [Candidatus Berkelbacteria bacterium]|nr:cation:proton antiporter [Candidatus Berkelbacteria bacterium]
MDQAFLIEFGLVLVVATGLGIIARALRQPLILAYLAAGVIIGPFVFSLVENSELIESFASIGIIFLLYLIGLELNPRKLIEVGKSALVIGIAQIVISGIVYYLAAKAIGLTNTGAIYLGAAFAFSSTAIIITLLSNRNDLESLHGKILIGVLLIQDFVAILLLALSSGFSASLQNLTPLQITFQTLIKAIILFALTYLVARYVLPPVFHRIARNQELLFLSGLAWCFLLAIIALALGFSAEIGAFLAGISLAPLPYSAHVAAKTKPLRDFFIMVFFIYLGTTLAFDNFLTQIGPALIFSLLILIVNPIIVIIVMSALGFRRRTSFITGITLTQISEFSFIVAILGAKLEILPQSAVSLVSLVAIITVFVSTYLISHSDRIYAALRPYLGFIRSSKKDGLMLNLPEELKNHTILVGCNRIGSVILETLKKENRDVVVVDVDPRKMKELVEKNQPCIYGDAVDHDIAEELSVEKAKMLISTIDKFEEDKLLVKTYKKLNRDLQIIVCANSTQDALELYKDGVDLVIIPTLVSGEYASHVLRKVFEGDESLKNLKLKEIKELKEPARA